MKNLFLIGNILIDKILEIMSEKKYKNIEDIKEYDLKFLDNILQLININCVYIVEHPKENKKLVYKYVKQQISTDKLISYSCSIDDTTYAYIYYNPSDYNIDFVIKSIGFIFARLYYDIEVNKKLKSIVNSNQEINNNLNKVLEALNKKYIIEDDDINNTNTESNNPIENNSTSNYIKIDNDFGVKLNNN